MPKKGIGVPICLVTMAMPLLIPWNVVGTIFQLLLRTDIGLVGYALAKLGISFNYAAVPLDAWITVVMMDVWHWTSLVVLLAYAGLVSIPDAYYQAARIDQAVKGLGEGDPWDGFTNIILWLSGRIKPGLMALDAPSA